MVRGGLADGRSILVSKLLAVLKDVTNEDFPCWSIFVCNDCSECTVVIGLRYTEHRPHGRVGAAGQLFLNELLATMLLNHV